MSFVYFQNMSDWSDLNSGTALQFKVETPNCSDIPCFELFCLISSIQSQNKMCNKTKLKKDFV